MTVRNTVVLLVFTHVHLQIAHGNYNDHLQARDYNTLQSSNNLSGEQLYQHDNFESPSAESNPPSAQTHFGAEAVPCSPGLNCAAVAAEQRHTPASSVYGLLAFLSILAAGTTVRSLLVVRSRISSSCKCGGRAVRMAARPLNA